MSVVRLGDCDMENCPKEATVAVEAGPINRPVIFLCEVHYAELNRMREVASTSETDAT